MYQDVRIQRNKIFANQLLYSEKYHIRYHSI